MAITQTRRDRQQFTTGANRNISNTSKVTAKRNAGTYSKRRNLLKRPTGKHNRRSLIDGEEKAADNVLPTKNAKEMPGQTDARSRQLENEKAEDAKHTKVRTQNNGKKVSLVTNARLKEIYDESEELVEPDRSPIKAKLLCSHANLADAIVNKAAQSSKGRTEGATSSTIDSKIDHEPIHAQIITTKVDNGKTSDCDLSKSNHETAKNHAEAGIWPEEELPPSEDTAKLATIRSVAPSKKVVQSRTNGTKRRNSARSILTNRYGTRNARKRIDQQAPPVVVITDTDEDSDSHQEIISKTASENDASIGSSENSAPKGRTKMIPKPKSSYGDRFSAYSPEVTEASELTEMDAHINDARTAAKSASTFLIEEPDTANGEANRAPSRQFGLRASVVQASRSGSVEEAGTSDIESKNPEESQRPGRAADVSKGAPPKSFYGNKASSDRLSPDAVQERLRALSFTGRKSFIPTPASERVLAKGRKVKKYVGTKARKTAPAKTAPLKKLPKKVIKSSGCCRKTRRTSNEVRDMPTSIISLRSESRQRHTRNRFFKHHHPVSNVKVYYQGGILKVAPHVPLATCKGPIDFDYKEDNISHVAEEGGKCDNFGLESVDDLERSGVVSRASLSRDGLRKRKAPILENTKVKRKRPSLWRYEDKRSPVKRIPAGLTLKQYEDALLREEFNFPSVWVRLERLPETKPQRKRRPAIVPKRLSMEMNLSNQCPMEKLVPIIVLRRVDSPSKPVQHYTVGEPCSPLKPNEERHELIEEGAPMDDDTVRASSSMAGFAPASPCLSPSPEGFQFQTHSSPQQTSTPYLTKQTAVPIPSVEKPPSRPRVVPKQYNPADDAFGFDNIDTPPRYRVRKMVESLFVVNSPEKRPKELTPKVAKISQPTINAVLQRRLTGSARTPAKNDTATVLSPFCRQLNPQMTSTPFEPTESVKGKRACNFYSKSSSIFEEPPAVASQKEKNGFTGFKRLLDRLGKRQLQIDAGQERFGAKTCTRCGMIFSQGEADDEKQHERFHKQMLSAVRFKDWKNIYVVDIVPELGTVYLMSPQDAKSVRDKVEKVMKFANHSIGFDWEYIKVDPVNHPDRRYAVFGTNSGKLASIVVIEPWTKAIRTLPGDELLVENGTVFNVSYSVIFAWTFPPYRRRGLASRLLFHLRVQLAGPGEEPIGFNQIAFSDPSPDLHRFVKGLTESETYLVAI